MKTLTLFLSLLVFSQISFAGDNELCSNHAKFVYSVANGGRNAGIKKEEVKSSVTKAAKHSPGFDLTELPLMMNVIDVVYAHPEKSPNQLAEDFMKSCMNSKDS